MASHAEDASKLVELLFVHRRAARRAEDQSADELRSCEREANGRESSHRVAEQDGVLGDGSLEHLAHAALHRGDVERFGARAESMRGEIEHEDPLEARSESFDQWCKLSCRSAEAVEESHLTGTAASLGVE